MNTTRILTVCMAAMLVAGLLAAPAAAARAHGDRPVVGVFLGKGHDSPRDDLYVPIYTAEQVLAQWFLALRYFECVNWVVLKQKTTQAYEVG